MSTPTPIDLIARALGNRHTAQDVAPHLTCDEVDWLAMGLAQGGHVGTAAIWLYAHGPGDEDTGTTDTDDRHHGLSADEALFLAQQMAGAVVEEFEIESKLKDYEDEEWKDNA